MGNIQVLTDEQIKKLDEMEGLTPSTVTLNQQLDLFPELNMNTSDLSSGDLYLTTGAADVTASLDLSDIITLGNLDYTNNWSYNTVQPVSLDDLLISGNPTDRSMSVTGNVNVKDGDININGVSLSDRLDKMEKRLGILRPNPELEEDFEKLKKLGDRYRKLEKKLTDQMKTYNILKDDNDV